MIEIQLYGKLRRFSEQKSPLRESIVYLDARDGDTIRSVVERMCIPLDELGRNIFLNGEYSGLKRPVKDNDRLGIFPDDMTLLYRQYFKKVEED
jgi:molybdopterin converting factor small subunit